MLLLYDICYTAKLLIISVRNPSCKPLRTPTWISRSPSGQPPTWKSCCAQCPVYPAPTRQRTTRDRPRFLSCRGGNALFSTSRHADRAERCHGQVTSLWRLPHCLWPASPTPRSPFVIGTAFSHDTPACHLTSSVHCQQWRQPEDPRYTRQLEDTLICEG